MRPTDLAARFGDGSTRARKGEGNLRVTKIDDREYQANSGPGYKSHRIVHALDRSTANVGSSRSRTGHASISWAPDTCSTPRPAAGGRPEKAQALHDDHRDAGRLVLPLHVEELQGGIRETQPVSRCVGAHMSGQQVRQKLYAQRRVQAQGVHGQAHRGGPRRQGVRQNAPA